MRGVHGELLQPLLALLVDLLGRQAALQMIYHVVAVLAVIIQDVEELLHRIPFILGRLHGGLGIAVRRHRNIDLGHASRAAVPASQGRTGGRERHGEVRGTRARAASTGDYAKQRKLGELKLSLS